MKFSTSLTGVSRRFGINKTQTMGTAHTATQVEIPESTNQYENPCLFKHVRQISALCCFFVWWVVFFLGIFYVRSIRENLVCTHVDAKRPVDILRMCGAFEVHKSCTAVYNGATVM